MNNSLLTPALFARVQQLARYFVWKRKTIHTDVIAELHAAQSTHAALSEAQQSAMQRIAELSSQGLHLQQQLTVMESARAAAEQTVQALQTRLNDTCALHVRETARAEERVSTLTRHRDLLKDEKAILATALQEQGAQLAASQTEVSMQAGIITNLEANLVQQMQSSAKLAREFEELSHRHGATWTRFEMVSRLLNAQTPANAGLTKFRHLLANDYMRFAEDESSLAAEANALKMLQSIEQDVALMTGFPDIYQRTIVGIVGGFSAGKSEFINSFIADSDVRLAVGISAVTVIPSYVLSSRQTQIRGYSANGGYAILDADMYKEISHAFLNSLTFDLKRLMPFMSVDVKMAYDCLEHICFVDTPGYNAPFTTTGDSDDDRQTAITFARKTDSLIWLIGVDATGTIPDSDLQFLSEIGLQERSLHVVLNKADLRAEDELDAVLDEMEEVLSMMGISVTGISAYSSIQRRMINHRGTPLMTHFAQINKPADTIERMSHRIRAVFHMYAEAINQDITQAKRLDSALKSLPLDALEIGGYDFLEKAQALADSIGPAPDIEQLNQHLREAQRLEDAFIDAVTDALARSSY